MFNYLIYGIMATNETKSNKTFEEYRNEMHPEQEEGREVVPSPRKAVALGFGIFMIIIYIGMAVLLFINYFGWTEYAWIRYFIGVVLVLYGIFRAYRYIINYKK